MSFDFRADQIRIGRIISSGSSPLLIYPSSSANNLQGGLTGFSTASVGTDVFIYVSGSGTKRAVFGGDVRVSGSLTASIATVDGTMPFIVGSGITVNYNSSKQYELTGSSIGGSDTSVQFNQNGSLSGTSSFTYSSGSLGVQAISGTNQNIAVFQSLGIGPGLDVRSNIALSNSFAFFSGFDDQLGTGGVILVEKSSINMFSGAIGPDPEFSVDASETANWANLTLRGNIRSTSGSVTLSSPTAAALEIYSGSASGQGAFVVSRGAIAGELVVTLTGAMTASRVNVPQITGSLKTVDGSNAFIVGSGITVNYNTLGQFEVTGSSGAAYGSGTYAARPATCAVGDMYQVTSGARTGSVYVCRTTNTWSLSDILAPTTVVPIAWWDTERLEPNVSQTITMWRGEGPSAPPMHAASNTSVQPTVLAAASAWGGLPAASWASGAGALLTHTGIGPIWAQPRTLVAVVSSINSGGTRTIAGWGRGSTSVGCNFALRTVGAVTGLSFYGVDPNGTGATPTTSTPAILVATYSGTNYALRQATLAASPSWSYSLASTATALTTVQGGFIVGAHPWDTSNLTDPFYGRLHWIGTYPTVLSESESDALAIALYTRFQ